MSGEIMAAQQFILGQPVTLRLVLDDAEAQREILEEIFATMAADINCFAGQWTAEQADTFSLTRQLTIFRQITYKGHSLTRSFMAQEERDFHWTIDEFKAWEPSLRRPTAYFHDAWHVHQFINYGPAPNNDKVLIDREQDAMVQQLDVASRMGCDESMIEWLNGYANDRERIRARLAEGFGIEARLVPHFMVL